MITDMPVEPIPCAGCGIDLPPMKASGQPRKWCSGGCRSATLRRRDAATYRRRQAEGARRRSAMKPVPIAYRDCIECGRLFVARDRGERTKTTCSSRCRNQRARRTLDKAADRQRRRASNQRRRARVNSAPAIGKFLPVDIYLRDGWICQLCGRDVDPQLQWPDLGSATTDHVVPLSLGGEHTPENCQLAHYSCNSRKAARLVA